MTLKAHLGPILLVALFLAGIAAGAYLVRSGGQGIAAPPLADATQVQANLLEHEAITHPGTLVGTAVNVAGDLGALIYLYHADIEASTGLVRYFIQGSPQDSGNIWTNLDIIATNADAGQSEPPSGFEAAGSTVIEVASTAGFADGEYIYFRDVATVHQGEWHIVRDVTATPSINLIDGLTFDKSTSDLMWSQVQAVEVHTIYLDLTGVRRIRMVVQNEESTGPNIHFFAPMVRFTDFE